MEHKVTMTVELTVEAPSANAKEEVEGVLYWKATSDINAAIGETAHLDGTIEFEKIELTPEQEAILTNMLMKGEHTYVETADFLDLTEDFVIKFAIENKL